MLMNTLEMFMLFILVLLRDSVEKISFHEEKKRLKEYFLDKILFYQISEIYLFSIFIPISKILLIEWKRLINGCQF